MEYSFRYRRRLTKPPTLPPPAPVPQMRPLPLLVIERISPALLDASDRR
jgi:hypothetical protein